MNPPERQKVAIITGASQGIGAGLVAGFRASWYAVVGTSRSIPSSEKPDYLTVPVDIAELETPRHVVEQTLDRFGGVHSLINNVEAVVSAVRIAAETAKVQSVSVVSVKAA
jgi:NAD(P)-dependent dehydrogenase (short-subunit alcohol dehydrogenase family)